MPAPRPLIVANWKMALTTSESVALVKKILHSRAWPKNSDVVVCPSFTALSQVADELSTSSLSLGAQDVSWEQPGAFTGEVSLKDLQQLGCRYVIVGHSERRRLYNETDEMVRRKIFITMGHGLNPILCVGENADQRRNHQAHRIVSHQVHSALKNVPHPRRGQYLVVAYEPVWAIGTGHAATPDDAREMAEVIRQAVVDMYGLTALRSLRVLYGGSVTPANVRSFVDRQLLHGVLLGGASQHSLTFSSVVRALSDI